MTPLIEKVVAGLLVKVLGAAWDKAFHKDELAGIYRRWQESFQSPEAGEREIDRAFEEFFGRKPVTDELAKVLRDRYAKVDFEVLIEQLRESFRWAGCPEPQGDSTRRSTGGFAI